MELPMTHLKEHAPTSRTLEPNENRRKIMTQAKQDGQDIGRGRGRRRALLERSHRRGRHPVNDYIVCASGRHGAAHTPAALQDASPGSGN